MTEPSSKQSNVIQFPNQTAIFSPSVRKSLEGGIKSYTEKPADVVSTFEQILCTHLVTAVRSVTIVIFTKLGERLGRAITGQK